MADDECRFGCAHLLGWRHFHDDFRWNHRLRAAFRPYDLAFWGGQSHRGFRGFDGVGVVWLFGGSELLGADSACHPVRLGSGRS